MIEQLLVFFSMMLGLGIEDKEVEYYNTGSEVTGYVNDLEKEINIQEIQKQIIIEDYFLFLDRLGRINYARGCAGEATPPVRTGKKRAKCGIRSFDCGGMMKYYGRIKNIITQKELVYYNSKTLYELGTPKDPRTAERGDFMYREGYGKASGSTHFAVVSSGYNISSRSIEIYDNMGNGRNVAGARTLNMTCNSKVCYYAGMYKVYIATNGMVELASKKGILVNAFKIIE